MEHGKETGVIQGGLGLRDFLCLLGIGKPFCHSPPTNAPNFCLKGLAALHVSGGPGPTS